MKRYFIQGIYNKTVIREMLPYWDNDYCSEKYDKQGENMNKYNGLAHIIITNVGGKSNIVSITHCITRIRFRLKDESKANTDILESTDGIAKVIKSGGQYQVVIGTHVADVYDAVVEVGKLSQKTENSQEDEGGVEEKTGLFNGFISIVTSVFTPIIGVLCAAGMLKGFSAAAVALGLLAKSDGAYLFWYNAGDALFYFLPVVIGWTAARKFKLSELTGIMIGLIMCLPALTSLGNRDVLGTIFGLDYKLTFLGIPVVLPANDSYAQTVIPVIVAVYVASKIEAWFKKRLPAVVKSFLVPFFTLAIIIPALFVVIGPITSGLSNILASVTLSIYNVAPWLEGLILGCIHQALVMMGLHWAYSPLRYNNFATLGYDTLITPNFPAAWTQGAAAMAVYLKTKDKKTKGICVSSFISVLFGVSEPAIYSINLPRKIPFFCASAAAGISGALIGLMQIRIFSGGVGIFALANFIDPETGDMSGVLKMAICIVIGMICSFLFTMIFYREKMKTEGKNVKNKGAEQECKEIFEETGMVFAPVTGEVISLKEVGDGMFSEEIVGPGCAIRPLAGIVTAPFDGKVALVAESKHAVGILRADGAELMIHVGLDTVEMNGAGFETFVKAGDAVKAGQKLLTFDQQAIRQAGHPDTTMIIVTNSMDFQLEMLCPTGMEVKAGSKLMTLRK